MVFFIRYQERQQCTSGSASVNLRVRQTRWRNFGGTHLQSGEQSERSARDLCDTVEVDSVTKEQAIAMTEMEARRRYGDELVVAALGVQIKDDEGPELKVRLLFDGTTGIPVKGRIRVRDQDRTTAELDIKPIIREIDTQEARPFGVKMDVEDAHWHSPIAPCD